MSKKNISKDKTRINNKNTKVPQQATVLTEKSYDKMKPYIVFSYVDKTKWQLSEWSGKELDDLINCFQKLESMEWVDIIKHKGLQYKALNNPPDINNNNISPDVTICELRVCHVKRIHGFRHKNAFCVVWFDRDHSVCLEGKNRKHG